MDKSYQPQNIEQRWYQVWEQQGYFAPQGRGANYSIAIPPPNITGNLHMGHAFQHSLMDALIRYQRMQGKQTLWQVGVDHASIATQLIVERRLATEGTDRKAVGREQFIQRVWQWKQQSGGNITRQMRRLGNSVDWSRERFTMDEGMSKAVLTAFVQLYREGLIYRGKRLVNWDPVLATAVSDLEVENSEEQGHLWYIRYPVVASNEFLEIATTRPETLLGDAAVAVHPEDSRYQHLIGKAVELPLCQRTIPIIADDYVDPEFASGCVKITPAHDFNDYEVGQRHQLPLINIFTPQATINEAAPEIYQGLSREAARRQVVEDLTRQGLMIKVVEHNLTVPRGDRSGAIIEPLLTPQWYVKVESLAKPAIDAVKQGHIQFVPSNWQNTYFAWMNDLQDWCISRQLWWGHRIPAWYDAEGQVYVGLTEAEVRQHHQLAEDMPLEQDSDVLDTWFSAGLWTFATLGWPEQTPALERFHPTQVLVTGFDIIFFWVARMIMMTLKFTGQVPFHKVYITGLIRDEKGQKMSKMKGNVLDPIDLIDGIELDALIKKRCQSLSQPKKVQQVTEQTQKQFPQGIAAYGTDALRFTFYSLASTGRDIKFDLGRISGYRNFCNKIWNAARYVLMQLETDENSTLTNQPVALNLADQWILACLQQSTQAVRRGLDNYRFDLASQALYEFIWHQYCDWYLELSKVVLYDPQSSAEQQAGTRQTLVQVLEALLRLAHPFMPFISEEIWQQVAPLAGKQGDTIMLQPYPETNKQWASDTISDTTIADMDWLQAVISAVRNIRGEMDISPAKPVSIYLQQGSEQDRQRLQANQHYITCLAKVNAVHWLTSEQSAPEAATQLVGQMKVLLPLAGLIDPKVERSRLTKQLAKLNKEISQQQAKLNNANFTAKAPAEVVAAVREKLTTHQAAVDKLTEQLAKVEQ
jgi:valyl-tRNA synthetase